jgi:hypothetical protein
MPSRRDRSVPRAVLASLALLALLASTGWAQTLVLPFRTVGVSDTTAVVACDLLAGELEARGLTVLPREVRSSPPAGADACDGAGVRGHARAATAGGPGRFRLPEPPGREAYRPRAGAARR